MPDLDLKPDEYRKQDPRSGRWLQNVDKKLCRWMALFGFAFVIFVAYVSRDYAHPAIVIFACMMAGAAGFLLALSLKATDW